MKKLSRKTEGPDAFKVPGWFGKLWKGTLFGKRKDRLILRILKLGGKDLLMSDCGFRLDEDMIDAAPAPSIKQLLAILHKAKAEWRNTQRSMARGAAFMAHPEDYDIKEEFVSDSGDTYVMMGKWALNKPKGGLQKKAHGPKQEG